MIQFYFNKMLFKPAYENKIDQELLSCLMRQTFILKSKL